MAGLSKKERQALKQQYRDETLAEKYDGYGVVQSNAEIKAKNEQLVNELVKKAEKKDGKYILMYRINMGTYATRVNAPGLNKVEAGELNTLQEAQKWIKTEADRNCTFYICTKHEKKSGSWKPIPVSGEKWVWDDYRNWHTTNWEPKATINSHKSAKAYTEMMKEKNES